MTDQSNPQIILLTGATGVLGARILKELLKTTTARVHCLVRGDDSEHCRSRLETLFRVYDPEGIHRAQFEERVVPVQGDVSQAGLGMADSAYRELQSKVGLIIHSAANTSLLASFEKIEPINVGGTERMIEFALGTREKNLCYVSTYTVMGSKTFDPNFVFRETDFELGQTFDFMNYQRSKFIAEGLVRKASERGLRWKIFRPGQIFGESDTGNYPEGDTQVSGLFYDLFKTAIETGYAFQSRTHFDVVPVNYCSEAIVQLAIHRAQWGETYHLTNPDLRTYSDVIRLVSQLGYPIEQIPEAQYIKLLAAGQIRKRGEERPYESVAIKAFLAWFFKAKISFERSSVTSCEFTRKVLEELDVRCAPLDLPLIRTYFANGVKKGYLPALPQKAALRTEAPVAPALGLASIGV